MKLLNKGKQGRMCGGQRAWEGAHAAEEVNGFKHSPATDTEERHAAERIFMPEKRGECFPEKQL